MRYRYKTCQNYLALCPVPCFVTGNEIWKYSYKNIFSVLSIDIYFKYWTFVFWKVSFFWRFPNSLRKLSCCRLTVILLNMYTSAAAYKKIMVVEKRHLWRIYSPMASMGLITCLIWTLFTFHLHMLIVSHLIWYYKLFCFSFWRYSQRKTVIYHSHQKPKDSLEGSLDRVSFGAELEFLKIQAPRLPQHTSNVNTECAGKSEWSKQLYSLYLTSFLEHWYILILLFWY